MQQGEKIIETDSVLSSFYGEDEVTAIINLKVDTKDADEVCEAISMLAPTKDVFLVTGDTDIVVKVKFKNYVQLKKFLVKELSEIQGVKDTKTLMVVAAFKEKGELKFVPSANEA